MATARDVVTRAARIAGVLARGESLVAEEASDYLDLLNDMIHGWELDGVRIGYTDMSLDDTVNFEESHMEAIKANLAVRINDENEFTSSEMLLRRARRSLDLLKTYFSDLQESSLDPTLTDFCANRKPYDITRG